MNLIPLLLLVWFSLTSAFGDLAEPTEPPVPSATERAVPDPYPAGLDVGSADRDIEERFLTRSPLPTCGIVELVEEDLVAGQPPPYDADCLQQALETGTGVESVAVMTTRAGEQVRAYFRLNPSGPMEILVDLRDATADRSWRYEVCEPPADLGSRPCRDRPNGSWFQPGS